ncbi:MAG: ABC transporter permease subunit [Proteobacteria bacterium]|nr:ABC transporter permease subunit [Pseudomonadota bacterium]
MFSLDPITKKKFARFRSIRRGWWSLICFTLLLILSFGAELLISNRALFVKYEGKFYFPTYGSIYPGKTFGLDYDYETNYRDLKKVFLDQSSNNFVLLPIVPWSAYESDLKDGQYPPFAPSIDQRHFLGTDTTGRDILARLVYGFRTAISFSMLLLIATYSIGVSVGCAMGYFGGKFDIILQRIIEIWSNVPFLYVIMIVSSIIVPRFGILVAIMVFFDWIGMTWYMRTSTYKEKAREYTSAAKALGASHFRIIFNHILPNVLSVLVTFIPFSVTGGIVSLTSLDYLGFGLPPPTPSWGELLAQGTANLQALWIVTSVTVAMIVVLTMVTFIGEAIREAFDPKQYSTFES